ncbi:MAG: hypothetical protein ACRDY1_03360 [Acidimicrobiales bacterium]
MTDERGEVTEATRKAEAEEAEAAHDAGVPATAEPASEQAEPVVADDVRAHYREMTDRGAHESGEGRVP